MNLQFFFADQGHPFQQQGQAGTVGTGYGLQVNHQVLACPLNHVIGLAPDRRHRKLAQFPFYGKLTLTRLFYVCYTQVTCRLFFFIRTVFIEKLGNKLTNQFFQHHGALSQLDFVAIGKAGLIPTGFQADIFLTQ